MTRKTVAFLSLRQIHHALHIAPIAYEMSLRADCQVTLFTSYQAAAELLRELGGHYPDHRCEVAVLKPPWYQSIFNVKRRTYPRPSSVLKNNAERLLAMDAIVSSDFYSLTLLDLRVGRTPLFVKTPHGAGAGAYGFKETLGRYDLLLGPGDYFQKRIDSMRLPDHVEVKLVGYPKLDIAEKIHRNETKLFDNDNPVVLYNPHFKNRLSSWPVWGLTVLDYFHSNTQYNLVFAPHINLFSRKHTRARLPEKYINAANILVDPGSPASVDMTYTLNSDLYLGDVSSQVLEFICRPRPCIFLNAHGIDWRDDQNYASWHLGRVLDRIDELDNALAGALEESERYRDVQMDTFRRLVSDSDESASVRAANAIAQLLKTGENRLDQRASECSSREPSDVCKVPNSNASEKA